jgi:hypothetical protein
VAVAVQGVTEPVVAVSVDLLLVVDQPVQAPVVVAVVMVEILIQAVMVVVWGFTRV